MTRLKACAPFWVPIFFLVVLGTNSLWLASCAHIVAPTGGPKDTTAPQVRESVPANFSRMFRARKLVLSFNEYVQLKDIGNQLIISPPLKKKPEVLVKGKKILIEIADTFKENTTYTFNFGNAITDLNEGNPLENYKYVFSTGEKLDSLYIRGQVEDAFLREAEKGMLVLLYEYGAAANDSLPYTSTPTYFSKTDATGHFEISNIRAGDYMLFALKDGNTNYRYDLPNEKIAFTGHKVSPADSVHYQLYAFDETDPLKYLGARNDRYGRIAFAFNTAVKEENVQVKKQYSSGKKAWEFIEMSADNDTLYYWFTDVGTDSIPFLLIKGGIAIDTPMVKVRPLEQTTLQLLASTSQYLEHYDSLVIECTQPILEHNGKKITLLENDSIIPFQIKRSKGFRHYRIDFERREKASYTLKLLPNAFRDLFGTSNDTFQLDFKTRERADYGSLKMKITAKEQAPLIVQLVDHKGVVKYEPKRQEGGDFHITHLLPGIYRLRLVLDENRNGIWDPGNYMKKQQSEKVIYYEEGIQIRANWDIEVDWNVKAFGEK